MINKNISEVVAKRYGSAASNNSEFKRSESKNNAFEDNDNETNDNVKGKPQHNRCVRPIHNNVYEE